MNDNLFNELERLSLSPKALRKKVQFTSRALIPQTSEAYVDPSEEGAMGKDNTPINTKTLLPFTNPYRKPLTSTQELSGELKQTPGLQETIIDLFEGCGRILRKIRDQLFYGPSSTSNS